MFYDTQWDQRIETDPFHLPNFIAWLESKDPDEKYNYMNPQNCAVAQYLKAAGVEEFCLAELPSPIHGIVCSADSAAWTFGAALERARSYITTS